MRAEPMAFGPSVQPSWQGSLAGLCPGCLDMPVVREETAAPTWAKSAAGAVGRQGRWGGRGGRRGAVRRPLGMPLSLRGCSHQVCSPGHRDAAPSTAVTHPESQLRQAATLGFKPRLLGPAA